MRTVMGVFILGTLIARLPGFKIAPQQQTEIWLTMAQVIHAKP